MAPADTDDNSKPVNTSKLAVLDDDKDNKANYLDLDSDNDTVLDLVEVGGPDTNSDGKVDAFTDLNANGWADILDPTATTPGTPYNFPDTDTDGKADPYDTDSDNDCVGDSDAKEAGGARINKQVPQANADLNCGAAGSGKVCDTTTGTCATACMTDSECTAAQFCSPGDGATRGICVAKAANGAGVPSNPPISGKCTEANGKRACVSAKCETSDNKCGLNDGSACAAAGECRSAACTSGKCGKGTVATDAGTTTDGGSRPDSGASSGANGASVENGSLSGGACSTQGTSSSGGGKLALVGLGVLAVALSGRRRRSVR